MNAKIVLLPGDGIGPEVVGEARRVLDAVASLFGHKFEYAEHLLGGCAIDATGTAMPEATIKLTVRGREVHMVAEGNGPVNAFDTALRKALHPFFPQVDQVQLADYKVRILNSNTGTGAITRVLIDWHDGTERRWSTVGAGTNILDATWLALADGYEYALSAPAQVVQNKEALA